MSAQTTSSQKRYSLIHHAKTLLPLRRIIRAFRIIIGVLLSIWLAGQLNIDFAPSTGIVTLLGIQNTKRENVKTAIRRIVSFLYTIGFAVLVHHYVNVGNLEFALTIFFMILLTTILEWESTLSINIVIVIHLFMNQKDFSLLLLTNEFLRVLIGMLIAALVNWQPRKHQSIFENLTNEVEDQLKDILYGIAAFLNGEAPLNALKEPLAEYHTLIQDGLCDSYLYANNNLLPHANYYQHYMTMRESEKDILEDIYDLCSNLKSLPPQAAILAKHIKNIAAAVPVRTSMDVWLTTFDSLQEQLSTSTLPDSYDSFKDTASLLFITKALEKMLQLKQQFVSSLSATQLRRYLHLKHNEKVALTKAMNEAAAGKHIS